MRATYSLHVTLVVLTCLLVCRADNEASAGGDDGVVEKPAWVLPMAPAGYGGPGILTPYAHDGTDPVPTGGASQNTVSCRA